jgi:hypothetical protein
MASAFEHDDLDAALGRRRSARVDAGGTAEKVTRKRRSSRS